MHVGRRLTVGAVAFALLVGGAGCSKIAEKAAEKATGCEDIDASGDAVGVTNCDGVDAKIDSDGNAAVDDDQGNSLDVSGQGTGSLPEGWPEAVTLPEGSRIVIANASAQPPGFSLVAGIDGEVAEIMGRIRSQLTGAGYTIEDENVSGTSGDGGESTVGTLTATGPDWLVSVSAGSSAPTGDASLGEVTMNWTLTEVAG